MIYSLSITISLAIKVKNSFNGVKVYVLDCSGYFDSAQSYVINNIRYLNKDHNIAVLSGTMQKSPNRIVFIIILLLMIKRININKVGIYV